MPHLDSSTNIDGIQFEDQAAALATPASGYWKLYAQSTGLKFIEDDGIIHVIHSGVKHVPLPLDVGGGTATIEAWRGSPSINLDADGETFYATFVAVDWGAASDMTLVFMVGNEIAEDDGDDVSITATVHGIADGETATDAGQAVACAQDLTGGDEAINIVNKVTGTIDYNEATHPIALGDVVTIKCAINLAGGGECTGPLHVIAWWVEHD